MYTAQNYNQILPFTFWMMLVVATREVGKQAPRKTIELQLLTQKHLESAHSKAPSKADNKEPQALQNSIWITPETDVKARSHARSG